MENLKALSHLFATVFLTSFAGVVVMPSMTDVTMSALCPGQDECSLAIYLTGFQQVVTGVGSVVTMPIIGFLSDKYGRKTLLTLPVTLSILPLVILAYSRSTNFFYAYYALKTLIGMVFDGSGECLALAFVADNISETQRASAFGILSGVGSAAIVFGTLAARFLSTDRIFQVSAVVTMVAALYMRIFLKDPPRSSDDLTQPILKTEEGYPQQHEEESSKKVQVFKKIPSLQDIVRLLKSSATFSQAAFVQFFCSLAAGGAQTSMLYFFRAQFHFNKNQFADLMLIGSVAGTISQLLFMPMLIPVVGEEKLLCIGLFFGALGAILNSVAWSYWVPYAAGLLTIFDVFAYPCLRSIISKKAGPDEQGMAHGCISSIGSLTGIISPFIFSPLTALFLSEGAPFHYPGFSIMCIGVATMIAFIVSLMIKPGPTISSNEVSNGDCQEA